MGCIYTMYSIVTAGLMLIMFFLHYRLLLTLRCVLLHGVHACHCHIFAATHNRYLWRWPSAGHGKKVDLERNEPTRQVEPAIKYVI